ncbi:hypothetical protein [Sphingomonas sp. LH128]|uniref:hypothetical protein n=1 Tax=Sphingomonas sp. LH128 TaxID=473781 RepID=UPI00155F318B|nr:hypothetical protein [Sphingomonas sp. LH128]
MAATKFKLVRHHVSRRTGHAMLATPMTTTDIHAPLVHAPIAALIVDAAGGGAPPPPPADAVGGGGAHK